MGSESKNNQKIIAIIGPTASGKSDLAVYLAQKFNGEVVSADSRQVYKKMDVGTGKITKEEMKSIPHHLLDVISPTKNFSVAKYVSLAEKAIEQIVKNNRLPIVCGGTAFYIDALIYKNSIPKIVPNWNLREKLDKKTSEELFEELSKHDKTRASSIDKKNKRRLIRALEIVKTTKKPVPPISKIKKYNPLYIGISVEQEELNRKIEKRLESRFQQQMIKEVKMLHKSGVSWKRLEGFGLEYKWIALYLQEKVDHNEMNTRLLTDIKNFSKRQMTWWKRNKEIKWIKKKEEAASLVKKFIY